MAPAAPDQLVAAFARKNIGVLVYLLHADPAGLRFRHYLGRTTPTGFKARMRRHALGTGSAVTRQWAAVHAIVNLAALLPSNTPRLETILLRLGEFEAWCPVCRGQDPIAPLHVVAGLAPLTPPAWSSFG